IHTVVDIVASTFCWPPAKNNSRSGRSACPTIGIVNPGERILGVEGGGTKTAWVLVERTVAEPGEAGPQLRILDQGKLPPSNFRLEMPDRLKAIFRELPWEIDRAGIFLAGCGTTEDRQ